MSIDSGRIGGSSQPDLHILIIPFPAQGHMLPLLDLAHSLASAYDDLTITIAVTRGNLPLLRPLLSRSPSTIRTLVLPFPSDPSIPPGIENNKDAGAEYFVPMIHVLASLQIQALFHGSRSMAKLEDTHGVGGGGSPNECSFFHNIEMEECVNYEDYEEGLYHPEKKRRLTSNQIESLEKSFDTGNKLEPDRKNQLAKDLGLQPRQVAIWFQNRRARWKTKQLEKDYQTLKQNYDHLKTNHESLHEEKEKLRTEVMVLKEKLGQREKNDTSNSVKIKKDEDDEKLESAVVCKKEEICSTKSVVMDSDLLQNFNMQKRDRKENSRGFGFLEEETDLWSWNY